MNPIIRRLLSHLPRAIANTTQINFHDGHIELDTICILQVTLSSYTNSCFQTMRRNRTKIMGPTISQQEILIFRGLGSDRAVGNAVYDNSQEGLVTTEWCMMSNLALEQSQQCQLRQEAYAPLETEVMTEVWWDGWTNGREKAWIGAGKPRRHRWTARPFPHWATVPGDDRQGAIS